MDGTSDDFFEEFCELLKIRPFLRDKTKAFVLDHEWQKAAKKIKNAQK